MKTTENPVEPGLSVDDHETDFVPILRSGAWTDIGFRKTMEDVHVCVDNFMSEYGFNNLSEEPKAFYGVFHFSYYLLLHICSC